MHIWVDASPLGNKPITGVENYTLNLINNLFLKDRNNSYSIFGLRINKDDLGISNSNFVLKEIPDLIKTRSIWYSWLIWNYFISPFMLVLKQPDVYLSFIPALPLYCPVAGIFIVYDISPIIIPDAFFAKTRLKFKMDIRHAAKYAKSIITISQSTKDDMIKFLNVNQSRVSVIYPGYDNKLFVPIEDRSLMDKVRLKYGIDCNYILNVGTLEPRKNTRRLIQAYLRLKRAGSISHKLVITGSKGWLYDDTFHLIEAAKAYDEIIFTGYVESDDLPALYSGADAFIYPSLYEGFGLPPLEAMACGTPVITSNTSSLPEVVGDAGLLVDPYSEEEIAGAIYKVVSDNILREAMVQKGLKRAKLFSWEKSASELLNAIESVANAR